MANWFTLNVSKRTKVTKTTQINPRISKQHKRQDIVPERLGMPRRVCVSRLKSSSQQRGSLFLSLQVSNLHYRQTNVYNKVLKRISMVW